MVTERVDAMPILLNIKPVVLVFNSRKISFSLLKLNIRHQLTEFHILGVYAGLVVTIIADELIQCKSAFWRSNFNAR